MPRESEQAKAAIAAIQQIHSEIASLEKQLKLAREKRDEEMAKAVDATELNPRRIAGRLDPPLGPQTAYDGVRQARLRREARGRKSHDRK